MNGNYFLIFILWVTILGMGSCTKKEPIWEERSERICYEKSTDTGWVELNIRDTFRLFYPAQDTSLEVCKDCRPVRLANKNYDASVANYYSSYAQVGYCGAITDPEPCLVYYLFNPSDFIDVDYPDQFNLNYRGTSVLLDQTVQFCHDDQLIGVLYWGRSPTEDLVRGRMYFTNFTDENHLFFMGDLWARLEDMNDLISILGTIEPY
ncbi:MAG: hypothetical protein R2824_16505 [Saprospiraceae bacterium]|nr:hypothetical protein [Lewinella sp.]